MPEDEALTGNPVFDYRAACRCRANTFQNVLLLGGVLLAVAGGISYFSWGNLGFNLMLIGFLFMLLGVSWGFYWRKKLRAEFRAKYPA